MRYLQNPVFLVLCNILYLYQGNCHKRNGLLLNFMVTPCINNIQHFNYHLTHTTLKNVELLKHFKISKTAPTCFGLQGNHHQGTTFSTWLKITQLVKSRYVEAVQDVVSVALTTSCTASTYLLLTKCVIFSQVLTVAP